MILKRKCFIRQPNINVCFFKVVSAFGVLFVLLPISQRAKAMVIYPMFVCKPLFRTTFLTSTGSLSQIIDGFSDSFSTEEKFHVLFIFRIFEFVFFMFEYRRCIEYSNKIPVLTSKSSSLNYLPLSLDIFIV